MATQHPDNADKYITIQLKPEEATQGLICQEDGNVIWNDFIGFSCTDFLQLTNHLSGEN